MTPDDIVNEARLSIGAPWRHQGRDARLGVDCIGLVLVVARAVGAAHTDTKAYSRHATPQGFIDYFYRYADVVAPGRLGPGHVAVFRETRYPCHCGIIGHDGHGLTLIHAYARRRRVVEERFTRDWWSLLVDGFAFRRES